MTLAFLNYLQKGLAETIQGREESNAETKKI